MQKVVQLEDQEGASKTGEADMRIRRQRPRVSDSEEPVASEAIQGMSALERRISALEHLVTIKDQALQSRDELLQTISKTNEELLQSKDALLQVKDVEIRLLLAKVAQLTAQFECIGTYPQLEADRLLAAGEYAAATVLLQRAIELGHLPSRALLAWLFLFGRDGIAKNEALAFELVQKGAQSNCHHCQGVLAFCQWSRLNTPIIILDDHEIKCEDAAKMALASAEQGSRYGQYALGALTNDESLSLASFQLAAEQNLDAAQAELGKSIYQGGHCPVSHYTEAIRWFQLAAAQGDPHALFCVGLMHEYGHGVPADNFEAIRWYRRAADAGHRRAVLRLQKNE